MTDKQINTDHIRLVLDSDFSFTFTSSPLVVGLAVGLIILWLVIRLFTSWRAPWRSFVIDAAEFGLGNQKIKLRPNDIDRQIAYKIWVELSTRKIGLEIDLDNDVISEVYDSWYNFFAITRELIKEVPVSKFQRKDTERIIRLSIDVLNSGIRPHLTKWQARFRRWYDYELAKENNLERNPQDIQKSFPEYEQLEKDMLSVNRHLIGYRKKMYQLISGL